jgi:hypothetical protein
MVTWLLGYWATWLLGYLVTGLPGYWVTGLPGYLGYLVTWVTWVTWLPGYLDTYTFIKTQNIAPLHPTSDFWLPTSDFLIACCLFPRFVSWFHNPIRNRRDNRDEHYDRHDRHVLHDLSFKTIAVIVTFTWIPDATYCSLFSQWSLITNY